jgi:hypothetical protein
MVAKTLSEGERHGSGGNCPGVDVKGRVTAQALLVLVLGWVVRMLVLVLVLVVVMLLLLMLLHRGVR